MWLSRGTYTLPEVTSAEQHPALCRTRPLCCLLMSAAAAGDTVLMVTPMFHANSWGISFSGETQVLGESLQLI